MAHDITSADRVLTAEHASQAGGRARLWALLELTKPGITRMVLLTCAVGFYMASPALDLVLFLHALVGTGLAAGGTNALNQYRERTLDASMRRTARRPLPSGRLTPRQALVFSWGIAVLGIAHLAVAVNTMTALLVLLSLVSYIYLYTPLKLRTPLATEVGAVPGALPILAGWVAAGGSLLDPAAWALFLVLFFWQLPHFFALAWVYRDDYRRAGFRLRGTVDLDGRTTALLTVGYTTALVLVSLAPWLTGTVGLLYLAGAALLGGGFLATTLGLLAQATERRARRIFFASILYLPLLLALLVLDKSVA
jgi:heme o synthase